MINGYWLPCSRRDPRAIALYFRHYSSAKGGRKTSCYQAGFTGQGQTMVLLTDRCDALFAWVRQMIPRMDGQTGVNCTVFRNEGSVLSSELIREADELAWQRWPNEPRHFTYVDSGAVRRKRDPGRCFVKAGWTRLKERSGRGLVILELLRPSH